MSPKILKIRSFSTRCSRTVIPFGVKLIRLENFGLLTYVALVLETTDSDLSLHVEGGTVVYRIYVVIGTVVYRTTEKNRLRAGEI